MGGGGEELKDDRRTRGVGAIAGISRRKKETGPALTTRQEKAWFIGRDASRGGAPQKRMRHAKGVG